MLLLTVFPALSSALESRYFRLGNSADGRSHTQGGLALVGGGADLDQAFTWMCARSGGGDFLVLRANGDNSYNRYVKDLCHANSVATLIIPDRDVASRASRCGHDKARGSLVHRRRRSGQLHQQLERDSGAMGD
ncbi:MAG TPA: hypothetical protein VG206_12910 [Terriglobia bacterium]|nr:hypothetical protein [Terriglobia bacterium]